VESFLFNLPHFREKLARYPRRANDALLAKLDALIAELTSPQNSSHSARG
jgi:hypothetical protein